MILGWIDWFWDRVDYFGSLCGCRGHSDPERGSTSDTRSLTIANGNANSHANAPSPATLEEVDRMYGTRKYHGPQGSFSRPGTYNYTGSPSPSPSPAIYAGGTAGSVVTTIESGVDLKEMRQ
jgi:hypothetical protein